MNGTFLIRLARLEEAGLGRASEIAKALRIGRASVYRALEEAGRGGVNVWLVQIRAA